MSITQQKRQHLNGLAQSNVIYQAGAQSQGRQKPQPGQTDALIGSKRRLQPVTRLDRIQLPRFAQARKIFLHPFAGRDVHPRALLLRLTLMP